MQLTVNTNSKCLQSIFQAIEKCGFVICLPFNHLLTVTISTETNFK